MSTSGGVIPGAVRKPKDYVVAAPGDLVPLDTPTQHPEPGVTRRPCAARAMVARWDVRAVHGRATAPRGAAFLGAVRARMPFPVRARQVDGGSECKAEFAAACQARGLPLCVLPPKRPTLNGRVARSHRTQEEQGYQCYGGDLTRAARGPARRAWETVSHTVRPQQALGSRTPAEDLAACAPPAPNEHETARAAPASVSPPV